MTPKAEIPVDKTVEDSFAKLQKIEAEIQKADSKVEQFKNEIFEPIYKRRREYLNQIPKFWYIVLAQHEDFQEYISVEDMKYLELISDLYVEFWDETVFNDDVKTENNDLINFPKKGFTITISFKSDSSNDFKIKDQEISKRFEWVINPSTGSRKLESNPVNIEWPTELINQNPILIKEKAKSEKRSLSNEEKRKYRQGMRSFFSFWQWTGTKPGKEYRNGEELATLLAEDIFPAALDYYVLAAPGVGENDDDDDDDDESGEELDLSDNNVSDEEHGDLKRQKKN